MDDLEFSSNAPVSEEPTNPPAAPQEPMQAPQMPVEPPREPGFYAWSNPAQPQPPVQPAAPRKESPFANSPYTQTPPVQPVSPQPPRQPAAPRKASVKKSRKSPVVLTCIACTAVLVTALTGTLITNNRMNRVQKDFEQRLDAYIQRIEQLENRLTATQSRPQLGTATSDTPVRIPTAEGVMTPAQVYAQCVPSVVAINCITTGYNAFGQTPQSASSGSGFVLSEDGYIVTNYHVVEGSTSIEINMYDGTTYKAEYIGGNEANDIALIKVDAKNLPAVVIGSSSDLIVGDQVAAIGNPLGELAATLTVGYVSAKDRIVTSEGTQINMLQTDAAINPGNSGGPLFNMYGEVIGITSAKYSGTTNSGATIEGIGFAIPTDDVMMMLEDLRTFGHITGGYLGVTVSEVDEKTSKLYGLPLGVLVRDVMPGSCAEKAGMRSQDIIINLAGHEVKNLNSLSRALNKCKGGQEVIVTVYRSGQEVELTVILDERPQKEVQTTQPTEPATQPYNTWPGNGFFDDWFGQFFG